MLIEPTCVTRHNEVCHFCSLRGSPFRIGGKLSFTWPVNFEIREFPRATPSSPPSPPMDLFRRIENRFQPSRRGCNLWNENLSELDRENSELCGNVALTNDDCLEDVSHLWFIQFSTIIGSINEENSTNEPLNFD